MNGVASSLRASARTASATGRGIAKRWKSPRNSWTSGRGWSVGSTGSVGASARCSRQWASWRSALSASRYCQALWSAYWTASSGRAAGRPVADSSYRAASSPSSTGSEPSSQTMWWQSSSRVAVSPVR